MRKTEKTTEVPVLSECGTCGGHTCQAVRHIEDVSAELDELRREVRASERHTSDRIARIWARLACLTVDVAFAVPEISKLIGVI